MGKMVGNADKIRMDNYVPEVEGIPSTPRMNHADFLNYLLRTEVSGLRRLVDEQGVEIEIMKRRFLELDIPKIL